LFDPKNLALNLERTETLRIWDSFYSHCEFHIGADWRTNRRKDKSAMLTDVTAAAFSPSWLPIPIRPPKRNRRSQREPDSLSGLAFRIQESSPLNVSKAHIKCASRIVQEKERHQEFPEGILEMLAHQC
jgi:hypothetical protein